VPLHSRMRAFHRDLIRGGHYGQRPCAPRLTGRTHGCTDQQCDVKISLANSEPSTHGTKRRLGNVCLRRRHHFASSFKVLALPSVKPGSWFDTARFGSRSRLGQDQDSLARGRGHALTVGAPTITSQIIAVVLSAPWPFESARSFGAPQFDLSAAGPPTTNVAPDRTKAPGVERAPEWRTTTPALQYPP